MTESPTQNVPESVLEAYGLRDAALSPITSGWINHTLLVELGSTRFVLQRLHPAFAGRVNQDIDAITRHLDGSDVQVPRVVPTRDGELWVEAERPWRLLTFVEGETIDTLDNSARAHSAGAMAGRFHRAVADLEHTFSFTRPGAHDTAAHLAKLRRVREQDFADPPSAEIEPLCDAILDYDLPELPPVATRIVHGDLKATNLLFDGDRAVALLDLDTLAHGTVPIDLGDALRSWCNTPGEASPEAFFDAETFSAAIAGYASSVRGWLPREEVRAVVAATETIALELSARFAADVYEDAYFGFDASRFSCRREHNLARTHAQLSLARSIGAQRAQLLSVIDALGL